MGKYLYEEDMNTGEYISCDDTLKAIHQYCKVCDNCNGVICRACDSADAMDIVIDIPKADVQPMKRGRWIDIYEYCKMTGCRPSGVGAYYWCSECMKAEEKTSDFCPNCGADMRTE